MASNEDILMQFNAEENVTSVVESMEDSVTSALDSIVSAMEDLDLGLSNLSSSADSVSSAFADLDDAFSSAEDSATSFQSAIENIDGGNINDVTSDVNELSDTVMGASGEVDNLSTQLSSLDGTSVSIDIESSGTIDGGGDGFDSTSEFESENTAQDTSALRTSLYDDLVGMSSDLKSLGDTAVESASSAEQGWLRFGRAIDNNGGNWEAQSASIKQWVKDYSNSMGRGVADTRTAMTTFLNMGMSYEDVQKTMQVTTNYAAQFGITQSQAAQSMQMAFMGAGRGIKRLGLDIKDFKDEAGNVDKEKLLNAIMEKTTGSAEKYADTYAARVQKMNNAINSLRTDFGKEIINTIEPLLPVVQGAVNAFTSLPGPIKGTLLGFAGLAGGAAMVAGPLIKMRAYMKMGGVEMGTLKKGLDVLKVGYSELAGGGGIRAAITAMKDFSNAKKGADIASKAGGVATTMGNTTLPGINTSGMAKTTTTVVKDAGTVGALAPEAEAAATGTAATGGALSGISAAFTSLIVPLLAIAAVIAVMIPIIAGLAAEALIFIKGIQLLIDALDFDKIDLTGAIEGIKQVGQALLEVGVAMAEMTFANIMTGLAVLTTGIPGLINPIQIAGQMLVQVAKELQVFNTVEIDSSVNKKITMISVSLQLVAAAMTNLTKVVMNMALGNIMTLGGLLGNVRTAITTAKNEITHAANEIATLKDLPDIDQGAVDRLEKVSSSLESVAKAMDALRSLRDDQNWDTIVGDFLQGIFGGVDIQQALLAVKDDLYNAASSLSIFNDMPSVPEGVSNKLRTVADALKSVAESISSLREIRDNYNWDSAMGNIFQGVDIPTVINNVRSDLYKVSASLRSLNDMSAIPEGTGGKIKKVTSTTKTVLDSINALKELNGAVTGDVNLDNVITNITTANRVIRQVASRLRSLGTIANIPEGLGGKIKNITNATKQLKGSVTAIGGVPQVQDGAGEKVRKAVSAVKNIAKQLNGLGGTDVSAGISEALTRVRDALNQLKTTLSEAGGGFHSAGMNIGNSIRGGINQGLASLNGVVTGRVNSATGAGASVAWTGGARMGNSATRGFQSAFKIAQIASAELTEAINALQSGSGAFYQTVRDIASKAVEEAKNASGHHSPGYIARMWGDEMGESASMVENRGPGLISSIRGITQRAVTAGQGNIDMRSTFGTEMTAARLNALNNMNQSSDMGKTQRPVSIMIGEGAIQLDARNLTTQESRQIIINGLEGLDMITGINVKGA